MESNSASSRFAALGHPGRMAVFRLLMRFAPRGARPSEIGAELNLKANTLSHYLAELAQQGLISVEREGRSLFYSVDLEVTENLIGFLVNDCCRGRPDLCASVASHERSFKAGGPINVLFLCSGNSARSICAEVLLRDIGGRRFRSFSAGTTPAGQVHPGALDVLGRNGHKTSGLSSKNVKTLEDGPTMDFVLTVCDRAAAADTTPWRGHPLAAYWGVPDPVGGPGSEGRAFSDTYATLRRRVEAFANIPFESLDAGDLQRQLDQIGVLSS